MKAQKTDKIAQISLDLTKMGLNSNEALIYKLLLNSGAVSIKPLLTDTGLKRGNAYYHLESLMEKGLVQKIDEPKQPVKFAARHPENLELLLAKQKSAIFGAEEILRQEMPDLKNLFQLSVIKPGVKFYEGKDGIIKIYEYLLSQGANIDSIEDKGEMANFIPEYSRQYPFERIKRKMLNRVIAPSDNPINPSDPKQMRETRLIPTAQFPFRMDIKIAGNAVSLISFQKDSPVGVLIENKEIADNFKILFELLWKLLEPKTGLKTSSQ